MDSEISQESKKGVFFTFVMLSFFCEGGHFALGPTICGKLFGAEGGIRVFSVAFSFCGIGSLIHILMESLFGETGNYNIGYDGFSYIYSILSFLSLMILIFIFKEEKAFTSK